MYYSFRKIVARYTIVFLTLIFTTSTALSQAENPVSWNVSYTRSADTIIVTFDATIDEGWHLYATQLSSYEGPLPTEFTFDESEKYRLVGNVLEEEPKVEYDPNFDMEIDYFEEDAHFEQKLIFIGDPSEISGYISFMVCNDERCLPPVDVKFNLTID